MSSLSLPVPFDAPPAREHLALRAGAIDALGALPELLAARGAQINALMARQAAALPLNDRLVLTASASGCECRIARVRNAAELRALPMPTLVWDDSGAAWMVRAVGRRWVKLDPQAHQAAMTRLPHRNWFDAPIAGEGLYALDFHAPLGTSGSFISRVLHSLIHERDALLAVLGVSLMMGALGALAPGLTWLVADVALPDRAPQWLALAALGVVLLALHSLAFGWLRDALMRGVGGRLQARVLIGIYAHILRLPYAALAQRGVGGFAQVLQSAERIAALTLSTGLMPLIDLVMALGYLGWITVLMPGAALALGAAAVLICAASVPLAHWHAQRQRDEIAADAAQQAYLHEMLSGAATIRAAGARRQCLSRWLERLIGAQVQGLRRVRIGLWLDLLFDGAHQWIGALMLVWGAWHCLQDQLQVGAMLALLMLADGFMRAAVRLGQTAFQLYGAGAHLRTVNAVLRLETEPAQSASSTSEIPSLAAAVSCRGLGFQYDTDAPWIMHDYHLEVPRGARLTLRGVSGAGKTTLLRLIAGLYTPSAGEVQVFGHDPAAMRHCIAYLPQDTPLFEGTLGSNLSLIAGQPLAHLHTVAERSGLADWINTLPMGYDTPVPSGGGNLSGGQRQLLALTAALGSQRPLLLLDEALSHLDRLTQRRLEDSGLFDGLTVILITHETPMEPASCL